MTEKSTKTSKASESAPAPVQKSSEAPRQLNGSQDAPSTNSPTVTQSKGRSKSN